MAVCPCLSHCREPRTGHSSPVVASQGWAEGKDQHPRPAGHDLHAALRAVGCLGCRAHCWLLGNLLSIVAQLLSCTAAFLPTGPIVYWYIRLFLPGAKLWLPLLHLNEIPVDLFTTMFRCLWVAAQLSGVSATPPRFVISCKVAGSALWSITEVSNAAVSTDPTLTRGVDH